MGRRYTKAHRAMRHSRSSRIQWHRLAFEHLESRQVLAGTTDAASYRYDIATGGAGTAATPSESILNPLNVTVGNFSKQFSTVVDGQVLAQPIYLSGVNLTGGASPGVHNVVFVATEHDSIYAIDADGGSILWKVSPLGTFNVSGTSTTVTISTVPAGDVRSGDISPEIGITGTPAIDVGTGYLFVVVKTKQVYSNDPNNPHYVNALDKINIADGTLTSTVIADTTYTTGGSYVYNSGPYVIGNGDGAINVGGQNRVYFNALRQMFRPAVVLTGGQVVLGSGSHGDNTPYHGWMLTYNESNLALTGVLNTSPNSGYSGVWQGDAPIVVDPQGHFYFETGNGPFNQNASNFANGDTSKLPIDGSYGDSVVKVAVDPTTDATHQNINGWGLKVVDYFEPQDQDALNSADTDLGSGGPIVLPDSVGSTAHPHLLLAAGKEGKVYLIDRDRMGGFSSTDAGAVQTQGGAVGGVLSAPAYFNGTFYYTGGYNGGINAFSIANGAFSPNHTSTTPDGFGNLDGGPVVSADGTVNGIVWALDRGTGQLRAYDAANLGHELYTSAQAANNADAPGSIMKYTTPMVADGHVFVGTGNSLVVYGIPSPPTAPPADPSGLSATSPIGSEVQLSWTDNSNNEAEFDIERSQGGGPWLKVGVAPVNATSFNDLTVQALSSYTYRVFAKNVIGSSGYTNIAAVTTTGVQQNGTGDGLLAEYYTGNSFNFDAQTPIVTRVDPTINFNWNSVGPDPLVGQTNFAVRWTGQIQAQYSEAYTFSTVSDDGIRVVFNGQTIIDNETYHGPTIDNSAAINLVAGQSYTLEVDFFQGSGLAEAVLNWSSQSTPQQPVPQSQLYSGRAPSPPVLLPPVAASGTQINLSWTEQSTNATGFEIDRKAGVNGDYGVVAVILPNTTSYLDAGLSPSVTYYYRVRALNFGANSAYSNEVSLTTPVPPITPSEGHPTKVTTTEIDFAWMNNASDGTITRVLRNAAGTGGNFIFIAALPPTTTSYIDRGPAGNGLTPGTKYDYHIQIGNIAGYSDFTGFTIQTLTVAPGQPAAVGADGQVTLSWTAPSGASYFNVYRGTSAGGENATPLATGLAQPLLIDTNVQNGTTYYYQITAVDSGGESTRSAETSATPTLTATVAPPPGTVTPVAGDTQMQLTWTAAPGALSYNVYQGTSSGGESLVRSGITTPSFGQSNLTNGVTYYYRVSSVNGLGEGLMSAEVSATPHPLPPPTPINVAATAGDGQVILTWTIATDALSYNIYRSTDEGDEVLFSQAVVGTSFVDTRVANGVKYFYQVSAANGVGESNLSLEVSATPLPPLPAAPSSLSAVGTSATQISLQWSESSLQASGFRIERTSDGATFSLLTTVDAGATGYVDSTTLVPGNTYTYRVMAVNEAGSSGPSNTAAASVILHVPPPWFDADIGSPALVGSAYFYNHALYVAGGGNDIWDQSDQFHYVYQPMNGDGSIVVHVATQGNSDNWAKSGPMFRNSLDANSAFAAAYLTPGNGAAFQWRPTAGGNPGNSQSAGYQAPDWLKLTRSGTTFTGYVATDGINWTQVDSTTITMGNTVYVGLATTSHNGGAISNVAVNQIAINSAAGQLPAVPNIPTIQALSGTSARVTWTESDTSVTSFDVLRQSGNGGSYELIGTTPANVKSFTDTGLAAGASFSYRVVASNTVGDSNPSNSAAVTLPVLPLAPSLLQFNQITTTSAGLSWQLNSSNNTGVKVYRRDPGANSFVLLTTLSKDSRACNDATIAAGKLYQYRVTAINLAGESGFTDAGVTTLPAAPSDLAASPSQDSFQLAWTAPAGALAFNVYRGLFAGGEGATPYAAGIASPSFRDAGVTTGTRYYYRVTAVNFSGESAASIEVAASKNAPPTAVQLSAQSITENVPGDIVGQVTVVDPDIGDSHTITVSDGRFEVVGDMLRLKAGQSVNYEAEPTIDLDLTATDSGGLSVNQAFTLIVINVNEPPENIALSNATIVEDGVGVVVGQLSASDPDANQTVSYVVDDSRFKVVGSILRLLPQTSFDKAAGTTVDVTVTATDSGAPPQNSSKHLTLTVTPNPHSWQNPADPYDVNRSETENNLDAFIINVELRNNGPYLLPPGGPTGSPRIFYDVNGDGKLNFLDSVLVRNRLQVPASGEGEGPATNVSLAPPPGPSQSVWLIGPSPVACSNVADGSSVTAASFPQVLLARVTLGLRPTQAIDEYFAVAYSDADLTRPFGDLESATDTPGDEMTAALLVRIRPAS